MKKKIFIPHSIGFVLLVSLFLGLGACGLLTIVLDLAGVISADIKWNFINLLLVLIAIIFLFYSGIRFTLAFKIHFQQNCIATYGDGLPKFEKIQYKCKVKYEDILDVAIVASVKDSKNHAIKLNWVSSSVAKKYLEFRLASGKKSRMCINYYTKKQVKRMLSILSLNMISSGNNQVLDIENVMQDWFVIDKSPSKRNKTKNVQPENLDDEEKEK